MLQWARDQGCPWDSDTCVHAVLLGHLAVLQWAKIQGCLRDSRIRCYEYAASEPQPHILKWMDDQGYGVEEEDDDDGDDEENPYYADLLEEEESTK